MRAPRAGPASRGRRGHGGFRSGRTLVHLQCRAACDSSSNDAPVGGLWGRERPASELGARGRRGLGLYGRQAGNACSVPGAPRGLGGAKPRRCEYEFAVDFNRAAVGAVGAGQYAVLSPYSASATFDHGRRRRRRRDRDAAPATTLHSPDSGTNIAPAFAAGHLPGRHRWGRRLGTRPRSRTRSGDRKARRSRRSSSQYSPMGTAPCCSRSTSAAIPAPPRCWTSTSGSRGRRMPSLRRSFSPGTSPARRRSRSSTRSTSTGFGTSDRPERDVAAAVHALGRDPGLLCRRCRGPSTRYGERHAGEPAALRVHEFPC